MTSIIKSIFIAAIAFSFLFISSCSEALQKIYYKKGRYITDRIEAGYLDYVKYEVKILQKGSSEYCYFEITYTESRVKMVTPVYEELKVSETESYSPKGAEIIADILSFPIKIITEEKFEGTHKKVYKRPTGRLVKGNTKTDGLITMPVTALSDTSFSVMINGKSIRGKYQTNSQGVIKIPAKPIVDYYLMEKKVDVNFRGNDVNISKTLPVEYLDKLFKSIYNLGW